MKEYYYVGYCPFCDIRWEQKIYDILEVPKTFGGSCPHCEYHLTFHWVEEEEEEDEAI